MFGLDTTHNNNGQLVSEACHNFKVLCPSRSIIHATSSFLQSCSNIRRMTCFWWQLTHNITIHTIRLSLKESCLEIDAKNVPTLAGCHLATHPKSGSCGSTRICLLLFLLSWKPINTNLAFALRNWPCLSVLMVSTHLLVTQFLGLTSSDQQDQKLHCQPRICALSVMLQQTV